MNQKNLEKIFFSKVYKGKSRYPFYRSIFYWLLDAVKLIGQNNNFKILNIYSAHDKSSEREDVYKNHFFNNANYQELDFFKDNIALIPFADNSFDLVITTKVILEHVSNPQKFLDESFRVLKKGGHGFFIAPLIRRQHQVPYDFFRFTQFGLENLLKKSGFKIDYIKPTNGAVTTAAFMSTFFVSGQPWPWFCKKLFFSFLKFIVDPVANFLDYYDEDRNIPLYFLVKTEKES